MDGERHDINLTPDRPEGTISLYDGYRPSLPVGDYRLVLQQTVKLEGGEQKHYYRDQVFQVPGALAPLTGDAVQARFPPSAGRGNYGALFPHLVLASRSLPWERAVGTGPELADAPWLMLLVLSGDEIAAARRSEAGPAENLLSTRLSAGILLPELTLSDEQKKEEIQVVDLPLPLLRSLLPAPGELRYLAHLRSVDTAAKVHRAMHADGEFAVLTANRLPAPGANAVHVVSLEGWGSLLAGRRNPGSAGVARLVSLATWTFTNDEDGTDTFGGLMRRLRLGPLAVRAPGEGDGNGGGGQSEATPRRGDADGSPSAAYARDALRRGYVPLEFRAERSDPTFGWYRGPLAATRWSTRPHGRTLRRADEGMVLDEATGVLDVSRAAAWQLGRLLALGDAVVARGLREIVRKSHDSAQAARAIANFLDLHRIEIERSGGVARAVVDWLAELVLLRSVPFHYLVPDARLLPRDSLRFFHLDLGWVEALVDGALSIAVHSRGDRDAAAGRTELLPTVAGLVARHRRRQRGLPPPDADEAAQKLLAGPLTGFLLRSRAVLDWPGLEVEVDVDVGERGGEPILRLDRPTDGVLLCLARGAVRGITFREPAEGLTFGLDEDGGLALRDANGAKVDDVRSRLQKGGGANRVLDVGALAGEVGTALGRDAVGPSALAFHLLRSPAIQTVEWTS